MDSAQDAAKQDNQVQQDHLQHGNSIGKATLTGLFGGVDKDTPAVIIPEGDERSISYAQLHEHVIKLQKEMAGQ